MFFTMLKILFWCPVLLVSAVQTLTIDAQLGTSVEDCFERISIGEQLPPNAIYRNVSELTTRECEQLCKLDKQCQTYDYGVGAKGNATCNLSNLGEKELREQNSLLRHPDYDIYVRRFQCEQSPPTPLQPQFDEENPPLHRPIFRPAEEEPKNPLLDEFLTNLSPYESRPQGPRPYNNHIDRPDDYESSKPDFDSPPSYGAHSPPEIPYRPERPGDPYRPPLRPDTPYRPERPYRPLRPLRPYDTYRPERPIRPENPYGSDSNDGYRPIRPLRPDTPYGPIRPVEPYRPERPDPYRPQRPEQPYKPHDPYRPAYPDKYNHSRPKPDPYDVLQFQDQYGRPPRPDNWRPDLHYPPSSIDEIPDIYGPKPIRPEIPPYKPEEPDYHYLVRPNKKPPKPLDDGYNKPAPDPYRPSRPDNEPNRPDPYPNQPETYPEVGYGNKPAQNPLKPLDYKPKPDYSSKPDSYGPIGPPDRPYKPNRPYDYPSKPYEKPSYNYNSQYASGYGQNQDNSIYVEIYDPPRPYKPMKPLNDKPIYSSQYGQDYGYGHGSYGYGSSSGYLHNSHLYYGSYSQSDLYGQNYNRPTEDDRPQRPLTSQGSYGGQSGQNLEEPYTPQSGYGSQKPESYKPSYSSQGSYGQNDYTSNQYGGQNYENNRPPYSQEDSGSGHDRPSYGSHQERPTYGGSHERPSYGGGLQKPPSYGGSHEKPPYGSNYEKPPYGGSQEKPPSYGEKPSYGSGQDRPSYGGGQEKPPYGSSYEKPPYGGSQEKPPSYGEKPSYGSGQDRPSYGGGQNSKNSYGSQNENKPSNESYRPDVRPVYEYELERPGNVPSYVVRPNGDIVTSRPMTVGDYGNRPDYGAKPEYGGGSGYGDKPGYEDQGYGDSEYGGTSGYGDAGYRDPGKIGSYKACFRRVLAGRRALRSHVRRVVRCERLEDCRRECGEERRFHCESFNYRLDPSFRGKGLCELTTKPIEAFDLRRDFVEDKDYDFYEIDRNSLEPNCPETLTGPGELHSGYLSSKPSQSLENRVPGHSWSAQDKWDGDFHGGFRGQNRFYDDRGVKKYNRRYEDQSFVPYQIGIGRSNDDLETWGQYGGDYGGSTYYKNRNDFHKSINHWGLSSEIGPVKIQPHGVKPWGFQAEFNYNDLRRDGDDDIHPYSYGSWKRGWWNTSGSTNGLDYGESNFYKPLKPSYGPPDYKTGPDCTSERRPGMSLSTGSIRRSLHAHNVLECEAACFEEREFKCVSYSYRYSNSHGSDNCFLSERSYRGLELSADSGSDVYAMPKDCAVAHKPWVESECFWHVRSGVSVSESVARAALTVAGLGACEAECIRAQGFFCRVFSFRFGAPTIGEDLPNCILTSSPPTSLTPARGLHLSNGHELYARGNYGRGCEPALFDNTVIDEPKKECYLQYDNAARLIGSAIKGHARVPSEQACSAACTDAPFRCLSFSYNNIAPPGVDNCLLSEIRLFDLQKGVDYEHSTDDWLFAFDLFNGQCWRKVHGKDNGVHAPELPRPLPGYVTGPDRPEEPSGPGYLPAPEAPPYISGPPSGPSSPSAPSGPSGPPSWAPSGPYGPPLGPTGPYKPEKPYPEPIPGFKPSYPDYRPASPSYKPGFKPYEPYLPLEPAYPGSDFKPGYLPERPRPLRPVRPDPRPIRPDPRPIGLHPRPIGLHPRPIVPHPRPIRPVERPYPGEKEEGPIAVSWSHYTVSGFPCRAGTTCAQNVVAGHWACEPEGGEVGSWDYCCAPSHRCGYSEGFNKPWCYVGPENDQWRPCSEKYYPYHQHNVPHPSQSQSHREPPPRYPSRPWSSRPAYLTEDRDKPILGPYISEADRKYWDDLYKDGPKAYYDKYGNPLPGYSRVPPISRPHIKYHHSYPRPGSGHWAPLALPEAPQELDPPVPGGLGVPRYWPVAYLHKGPPPNITYFKFNETTTTTERYNFVPEQPERYNLVPERPERPQRPEKPERPEPTRPDEPDKNDKIDKPELPKPKPGEFVKGNTEKPNDSEKRQRDDEMGIIGNVTDDQGEPEKNKTTTPKNLEVANENPTEEPVKEVKKDDVEIIKTVEKEKGKAKAKGIDDKLEDLTGSIEVLDIEDAKTSEKESDVKTLEAEERQIEAIGRLLASRRGGQLILEKRSQKDLESKNIAIDKDLVDFNFGNRFPTTERRGIIQKVTKDEIERVLKNDRSLEVSETTFVRPPRVLSTTENIRKAIVNGKVFYDATIREERDLLKNSTRKPKSFRQLEDSRAPSVISNNNNGKKKVIKARNVNPVRRVRRVYRKRYNPEEVRKRLLERDRSLKEAKEARA